MKKEQIEQAVKEHLEICGLLINHEEDNYAAGVFEGFLAGAEYRQEEIDTLRRQKVEYARMYSESEELLVKHGIKQPAIRIDHSHNA